MAQTKTQGTVTLSGSNFFAIDLLPETVRVVRLDNRKDAEAGELEEQLILPSLPGTAGGSPQKASTEELWSRFSASFQSEVLDRQISLEDAVFIVGAAANPLCPVEGRLHCTLRLIEYLAKIGPRLLVVQTRSPLLVLAVSLLRALGGRAVVCMMLESRNDALHPGLPRHAERIKTVRILQKAGIRVMVRACPPQNEAGLATYARALTELNVPTAFGSPLSGPASGLLRRYFLQLGSELPQTRLVASELHYLEELAQSLERNELAETIAA